MMAFNNRGFTSGAPHEFNVIEATSGLKTTKPSLAQLEGFITGGLANTLVEAFSKKFNS